MRKKCKTLSETFYLPDPDEWEIEEEEHLPGYDRVIDVTQAINNILSNYVKYLSKIGNVQLNISKASGYKEVDSRSGTFSIPASLNLNFESKYCQDKFTLACVNSLLNLRKLNAYQGDNDAPFGSYDYLCHSGELTFGHYPNIGIRDVAAFNRIFEVNDITNNSPADMKRLFDRCVANDAEMCVENQQEVVQKFFDRFYDDILVYAHVFAASENHQDIIDKLAKELYEVNTNDPIYFTVNADQASIQRVKDAFAENFRQNRIKFNLEAEDSEPDILDNVDNYSVIINHGYMGSGNLNTIQLPPAVFDIKIEFDIDSDDIYDPFFDVEDSVETYRCENIVCNLKTIKETCAKITSTKLNETFYLPDPDEGEIEEAIDARPYIQNYLDGITKKCNQGSQKPLIIGDMISRLVAAHQSQVRWQGDFFPSQDWLKNTIMPGFEKGFGNKSGSDYIDANSGAELCDTFIDFVEVYHEDNPDNAIGHGAFPVIKGEDSIIDSFRDSRDSSLLHLVCKDQNRATLLACINAMVKEWSEDLQQYGGYIASLFYDYICEWISDYYDKLNADFHADKYSDSINTFIDNYIDSDLVDLVIYPSHEFIEELAKDLQSDNFTFQPPLNLRKEMLYKSDHIGGYYWKIIEVPTQEVRGGIKNDQNLKCIQSIEQCPGEISSNLSTIGCKNIDTEDLLIN